MRSKILGDHNPYGDLVVLPLDLQGWNGQRELFAKLYDEVNARLAVEVGTWKGQSAVTLGKHIRSKGQPHHLVCVDTWLGTIEHWTTLKGHFRFRNGRPDVYEQFLSNIVRCELTDFVTPLTLPSTEAAQYLAWLKMTPDYVYIDANHDFASVLADFVSWWPIVKPGGVMLGDDIQHPPIQEALAEAMRLPWMKGLTLVTDQIAWWVKKPA